MMKSHKKKLIMIMITALVILNIWRWLPTSMTSTRQDVVAQRDHLFNIEDFVVRLNSADSMGTVSRDIFQTKKAIEDKKAVHKTKSVEIPLSPVKSQEEFARDNAEAEFGRIRCVAISVRNERFHAYLISEGESFLVSQGDKVGSRFLVETITADGVVLRDPETGAGGVVSISGK